MNFFVQLKESVVDFDFYRKIKDNRFSKSFVYLMLLLLIITSIGTAKNYVILNRVMADVGGRLSAEVPEFALKNGEFSFQGQMPHYIVNEEDVVFVIDTTGGTKSEILDGKSNGLLLTKDMLYTNSSGQRRELSFKDIEGFDVDKSTIVQYLPQIPIAYLLLSPLFFIFQLVWKLLNVIILAVIGLIFNGMMNTNMPYKKILNISAYALSLPLLLQLAGNLAGGFGIIMFFVYWAVSILYVYQGIKNCKESPVIEPEL